MENRAAEMNGSCEVRPFQIDRNITEVHLEHDHRIIYKEIAIMASPKVIGKGCVREYVLCYHFFPSM